jgi:putative hemolysin
MPSVESKPVQRVPIGLPRPKTRWIRSIVDLPIRLAERALGLDRIEELAKAVEFGDPSKPALERALDATGIIPRYVPEELARIPETGAVAVFANHPYGGADGALLAALAMRRRPDVKILANNILSVFPFMREHGILVDPFGGADAARRNAAALREAIQWLKAGHVLVAFPAGEVSAVHWGDWTPQDPPWSTIPARLALAAGARVVPVWFEGGNRPLFHAAGLVHPRLRTALLPSEFVARCGHEIEVRFGRAIATSSADLDPESLTRLVRGRCELLRKSQPTPERTLPPQEPVGAPESSADQIAAELAALPPEARLFEAGAYDAFAVYARQVPRAMREIGRLREIAFRAVGEGSGHAVDVDRFDETYVQLILWNRESREIIGGYRAGVVDEVTQGVGVEGLYTSTLFDYSPAILDQLSNSVELGRSFVRVECQRQPMPLSLLWRAIAVFMITRGHRRMFGPVSISNEYDSMSKELIMQFLERHRLSTPFAKLVTPRHPPARRSIACWTDRESAQATSDIHHVERLIEEIERGQRAVPVLLRQYLRLNANLLAFNVDPDFGDVLDALMMIDIAQIDERIVRHYAGDEAVALIKSRLGA